MSERGAFFIFFRISFGGGAVYGVVVVVVGSIFRLHYEAILKENARVMKKTNSDREEKKRQR